MRPRLEKSALVLAFLVSALCSASAQQASSEQAETPAQEASATAEPPFEEQCLPPGATTLTISPEISIYPGTVAAIQSAVDEWNGALKDAGVFITLQNQVASSPGLTITVDPNLEELDANSAYSQVDYISAKDLAPNTEAVPDEVENRHFLTNGQISVNPDLLATPTLLRDTVFYQLGAAIGINNPDFSGSSQPSARTSNPNLRAKHLTAYDRKAARALYRSHRTQARLLTEGTQAKAIKDLEKRSRKIKQLNEQMESLMEPIYQTTSDSINSTN